MSDQAFWRWAAEDPERLALVAPDGSEVRAGALLSRCNQVARALEALCEPGDVVAMAFTNEPAVYELALAVFQAGIYLVPVNWHLTAPEIAYILKDCGAKALFCSPTMAPICAAACDEAGLAERYCSGELPASGGFARFAGFGADLPVAPPERRGAGGIMNYTSGTTGQPKGVRRTLPPAPPEPVASAYARFLQVFRITPGDGVHIVVSPLYHTAVLYFSLNNLHLGNPLVIMDKWTPDAFLERVERHGVTNSHMVPTQLVRLLNQLGEDPGLRDRYDLSSMKHMIHSAAPCPVPVKHAIIQWWGPVLWEYYAATEGGGTVVSPEEWLKRPGTVGRPWQTAEIAIFDEDGDRLGADEPGLVYIKMAQGFEYHRDKAKTEQAHRTDGYFTVGDIGYLDEEGYLFLCDRKADMIISGGVNIYPAEIESVFITHPNVADVAVFGVPDADWGERVHAVIEPQGVSVEAADGEAIVAWARERLARYKCPRTVDFIAEMPRDPNGKLSKRKLRDPFWTDTGRAI